MIPVLDQMLTRKQAAEYLNIKPATLEVWASRGSVELPFSKLGRSVRYRQSDLDKFLESTRRTKASD